MKRFLRTTMVAALVTLMGISPSSAGWLLGRGRCQPAPECAPVVCCPPVACCPAPCPPPVWQPNDCCGVPLIDAGTAPYPQVPAEDQPQPSAPAPLAPADEASEAPEPPVPAEPESPEPAESPSDAIPTPPQPAEPAAAPSESAPSESAPSEPAPSEPAPSESAPSESAAAPSEPAPADAAPMDIFGAPPESADPAEEIFGAPSANQPEPAGTTPPADAAPGSAGGDSPADIFGTPDQPAADADADAADTDIFGPTPTANEGASADATFGDPSAADTSSSDNKADSQMLTDLFQDAAAEADPAAASEDPLEGLFRDTPQAEPASSAPADDSPARENAVDFDSLFGAVPADRSAVMVAAPVPATGDPLAETTLRTWIDDTGTFSTRGRLIEVANGHVRLLKQNGRTCTVPEHRMSRADKVYVEGIVARLPAASVAMLVSE